MAEPGYYHDNHFGCRIENILLVQEVNTLNRFGDKPYLGFENVTYVPMGQNMIRKDLLSPLDVQWLNTYHKLCWEKISPLLQSNSLGWKWLQKETRPL
jgi:Xaa-Pro aminopeptidase